MRSIRSIVTLLAFAASPALAQGLPGLEKRVAQLEAQNTLQQQQIDNLQTQILNLSNAIPPDDGTAQALVGTWGNGTNPMIGSVNSLEFDPSQLFFTLNSPTFLVPFVSVPRSSGGADNYGVNPQIAPPRITAQSAITFSITRQGMIVSGTGTASAPNEPTQVFCLTGIALSNNFFLLKVRVPIDQTAGPCPPAGNFQIYQGVGSLNPNRDRMTFTGSAFNGSGPHQLFRAFLMKQQ